ncbi:MAG: primosomal replication protein N [Brachymonas sp.]|nr:primosomal replication protein N [Brachymonas sp.]MDO4795008.1 primosomal replication protein N [Brachymonas sp.]
MKEDSRTTHASHANHWCLTAQLAERGALRFSPAGIPAIDCVLQHQSEVMEAGVLRKVQVQLKAVAVGPVAEQLERQTLGMQAQFKGFLGSANRSRPGMSRSSVIFHIQSFAISDTAS